MGRKRMTASEAVFGFGVWLTTRREVSGPFSSHHLTPPMVELVGEFCKVNKLGSPRESWPKNLTIPKN